jgi:WD40 repeat protein
LRAFQPEHASIFFGREIATREIVDRLKAQATKGRVFLMLLGMSGCGKSSLARAGVIPAILRRGETDISCWRYAAFRPSESTSGLLLGLANSLLQSQALPEITRLGYTAESLACLLKDAAVHSIPLIQSALQQAGHAFSQQQLRSTDSDARLLLLIDQFEEVFTIERFAEEREAFIATMADLSRSGLIWLAVTLRSDMYARAAESETLRQLKGDDGQYDVVAPGFAELAQMVRRPAIAAGLHYEADPKSGENLDDALLGEASKNPEALPLLEFTLDELYKDRSESNVLTWNSYRELGGMGGAIAKRAEAEYESLSVEAKNAVPFIFARLVSLQQEKATGGSAVVEELKGIPGAHEVVRRFVAANLFTTTATSAGETVVSISHEALLEKWPRVRDWITRNREFLRVKQRLASAAQRWIESGKDSDYLLPAGKPLAEAEDAVRKHHDELSPQEVGIADASIRAARARRFRRRAAIVALTALIMTLFGGGIYFWQNEKIRSSRRLAEQEGEATKAAQHKAAETYFRLANMYYQQNDLAKALAYLAAAARSNPSNVKVMERIMHLLPYCPRPPTKLKHDDADEQVEFSSNGRFIVTVATAGEGAVAKPESVSESGVDYVQIFDADTGERVGQPIRGYTGTNDQETVGRVWLDNTSRRLIVGVYYPGPHLQLIDTGLPIRTPPLSLMIYDLSTGLPISTSPLKSVITVSDDAKWAITMPTDGKLEIRDVDSGELRCRPILGFSEIESARFSSDSDLIVLTRKKDVTVVSAATGKVLGKPLLIKGPDPLESIRSARFSDDGAWLIVRVNLTKDNGETSYTWSEIIDVRTLSSGKTQAKPVRDCIDFSCDGRLAAIETGEKTLNVISIPDGKHVGSDLNCGQFESASFSPDGRLIATWDMEGTVRVWDVYTGLAVTGEMRHEDSILELGFSPDGKKLATLVGLPTSMYPARIWDLQPHRALPNAIRHTKAISALSFSTDGKSLLTGSEDTTARVWDWQAQRPIGGPLAHPSSVSLAGFTRDSSTIITATNTGAYVWNANTRTLKKKVDQAQIGDSDKQTPIQLSNNHNWFLANFPDGKMIRIFDGHTGNPISASFNNYYTWISDDGQFVAQVRPIDKGNTEESESDEVQVYDANTGSQIGKSFSVKNTNWNMDSVSFDRSGRRILCVTDDEVLLADWKSGNVIARLTGRDFAAAAINLAGDRIVTASDEGYENAVQREFAEVWDVKTGKVLTQRMIHSVGTQDPQGISVNFSEDGRWVITACADAEEIRIWDAETGLPVSEPFVSSDRSDEGLEKRDWHRMLLRRTVHLSPDGRSIAAGYFDGEARVFNASYQVSEAPDWLPLLCEFIGGMTLNVTDVPEPMQIDPQSLLDRLRNLPGNDDLSHFGRWFAAQTGDGTINPLSDIKVSEFVAARITNGSAPALAEAYLADIGNPAVLAALAKPEKDKDRALFLCHYALKLTTSSGNERQIKEVKTKAHELFPQVPEFAP